MSTDDLNPTVVLHWLRAQAKRHSEHARLHNDVARKFNEAAAVLESVIDPSSAGHSAPKQHEPTAKAA